MRFQVPQFIEIESKIFGPLTLKQFIYLAGGVGLSFILWRLLPNFIAIVIILPVVGLSVALAFYKVNNRPFINLIEYAVNYFLKNKLYLWEMKKAQKKKEEGEDKVIHSTIPVPKLSESKLKDLAWSLDIKENLNPVTPPEKE